MLVRAIRGVDGPLAPFAFRPRLTAAALALILALWLLEPGRRRAGRPALWALVRAGGPASVSAGIVWWWARTEQTAQRIADATPLVTPVWIAIAGTIGAGWFLLALHARLQPQEAEEE